MTNVKQRLFKEILDQIISKKLFRGIAVKLLNKYLYKSIMGFENEQLAEEKKDQYAFSTAVAAQARNNLDRKNISPAVVKKMVKVFVGDSYTADRTKKINSGKKAYREQYGENPPHFLVLAPGKGCNLKCTGCYASADGSLSVKLDFSLTHRIVSEAHDVLGCRFLTISGGEPFLYKSEGKSLLQIFEEFSDIFFLVYTNGTLINKELAQKLAELGNVTPAISLEGWESHTDHRRGKGVFQEILNGMEHLRRAGVPFGISVTATRENIDILLQDQFYEFFFNDIGISYMWQFQMMPIGKAKDSMEMLITPAQRVQLFKKWKHLLRDKNFPIADFWNSGSLSSGCIAYGRWAGYFYIDWNGNIMPCVFVPYYVNNVRELYQNDQTIAEALHSKFFRNGRKWQEQYGFNNPNKRENILMPCSFRDHYLNFRKNILTSDAKGENKEAIAMLNDPEYEKIMLDFDDHLQKITDPIFREHYLEKGK